MRAATMAGLVGLAACGDSAETQPDPAGAGHGVASSGPSASTPAASTVDASTTAGASDADTTTSGGGGSGAGGAGGGGGGPGYTCSPPPLRVAAGDDFTCALGEDGIPACRGGPFGNAWSPIELAPDLPATCVDALFGGSDAACIRVASGAGCPPVGVYCTRGAVPAWTSLEGSTDESLVAVTDDDICTFEPDGSSFCGGGSTPPDLVDVAPLGGVAARHGDTCVWGEGGIRCWGPDGSAIADSPAFPVCPADVAVGDGFACFLSGFDTGECWGDLPRGIPPQFFMPAPGADVALGDAFACVLTTIGVVLCVGDNATGALGVPGLDASDSAVEPDWPDGEPEGIAMAAGAGHVALVTDDGAVLAWGDDRAGQVCDCTDDYATAPIDTSFPGP